MKDARYHRIMNGDAVLTKEEFRQGWHFCPDWDLLLVGPGMPEAKACTCPLPKKNEHHDDEYHEDLRYE